MAQMKLEAHLSLYYSPGYLCSFCSNNFSLEKHLPFRPSLLKTGQRDLEEMCQKYESLWTNDK